MKILVDGRLLDNKPTGISRYSEEIIKMYISKFGYDNVKVLIKRDLKKRDFKYIETDYKPFNLRDYFFFHKFLKKIEFDVYHSLFYSNSFFKIKNKKYIITVHDMMYSVVNNFFNTNQITNNFKKFYFDFIVGRSLKNSDFIISVSETTQKDTLNLFKINSVVIGEGVNILTNTGDVNILDKLELIKKGYLLYVGNSRPHKNLDFLIKGFLESKTDKKLVLCGNKKGLNRIENKRIIYTDFISDSELKVLYENCSAFIFPSKYEGFGLPILEALNYGAKVISSDGGALKEFPKSIIKYFSPYDIKELKECIESIDNYQIDKLKLEEVLKNYSWENTEKKYNFYWKEWLNNL